MHDKELQFEPMGTVPAIGDHVVCFGDSTWRREGKPYLVLSENEHDIFTDVGQTEAWDKRRFAPLPDDPRVYIDRYYRVVKRISR